MKRNYNSAPDRVRESYRKMRERQNLQFVKDMETKYNCASMELAPMNVWDALHSLDRFVDLSDPDMELPNVIHLLQTAEAMRKAGEPEWMQVVGLIHDLGKCIYLRGNADDGTSMEEQWSIVGDTFVVGDPLPDQLVFPEFNELNSDSAANIYQKGCGLRNVHISYGHDEYLYRVLERSGHNLPLEGLYMIRYHSLYPWHKDGCYTHLEDALDREMKGWVQRFNRYDLYTKQNQTYSQDELELMKDYYTKLLKVYVHHPLQL